MGYETISVKILGIFLLIFAALMLLLGIFLLLASLCIIDLSFPFLGGGCQPNLLISIMSVVVLFIGIGIIILGVGLWKYKQWARIVSIVLLAIGFINSIFSFVTTLFTASYFGGGIFKVLSLIFDLIFIIVSVMFIIFLLFNKKVKKLFERK